MATPIGLDAEAWGKRDELKKTIRDYVNALIQEPTFAEQFTDSHFHSVLPRRILQIVQRYYNRAQVSQLTRYVRVEALI